MTEKKLTDVLKAAGWTLPDTNPFWELGDIERTAREALTNRGWKPPAPEWKYWDARTNHVHGWQCDGDTMIEWQANHFPMIGQPPHLKALTQHRNGIVQARNRYDYTKGLNIAQLGYWPNADDRSSDDFVVIYSQVHNR